MMKRSYGAAVLALALLAGVLTGLLGASPAVAAASVCSAGRCLTEVQLTPVTADLTRTSPTVTVKLHLTTTTGFGSSQRVSFERAATTLGDQPESAAQTAPMTLTRSSGTAKDGWWTGTTTLPTGWATTWDLSGTILPTAVDEGTFDFRPVDLAAAGLPYRITSSITAGPPAAPTGAVLTTALRFNANQGRIEIVANASWSGTSPGGIASAAYEYSATGACGPQGVLRTYATTQVQLSKVTSGWCYLKVRALNAKGVSAWSGTAQAYLP